MKTYLVTGGAGFIGSNFISYMLDKYTDIKIINLDKLTYAGNLENLSQYEHFVNYKFIKGDIKDSELLSEIFENNEIDYVVNFAAESHVDRSIENPQVFVETNVLGTLNLLNTAKEFWQTDADSYKEGKKFIQISTDEVYGSLSEEGYFTEETPLDPHSPYSASKASGDLLVQSFFDTYKFPMNITRCSNNYGPFQFPEKLIPLVIHHCIEKKSIPVYGDGLNVRDWLFVEDHCSAVDLVIQNGQLGEVYNIGGHNEKTNIDLVKKIITYLNEKVDHTVTEDLIAFVRDRKGHDRRYAIDPTKIEKELQWQPKYHFETGIIKTIDWYLDNSLWFKNIIDDEYKNYYQKAYNTLK
ncbi:MULTISPECIES: dTDP-glucose 4,6-dehydratase [Bacillus]|uniref:dTDP-glucose 4,6-dehydratase n=1 Tax=Bacillus TaxID=1386 RepID=UPI0005422654|nr:MULTISPECIES: dTDP-glucose 4,6-dehydratase [Bacillus]KWZ66568.1 dTDP-glucose 4,6-dehydratase [Bacillus altitudinis]MEE3604187.1 dTDP-glucose 4,6-dehydratase [Bacillus altitudinis]MEE3610285.1 dTDP-glucose 4,6-dehydratase [Bacillus altitudinis]MEE3645926.1 dTDP-glucose 4,6-dehydratase [Bacillus altitudinis]MEE4390349.1 dTDP-glucose 4,6-dehydratase [Bacillus altitudinis]